MIRDEVEQEQIECEKDRKPLIHHTKELDAGHATKRMSAPDSRAPVAARSLYCICLFDTRD
jgi:hypothetical protein